LTEQISNTEDTETKLRYSGLKRAARLAGRAALCTFTVCVVATPFVSHWANIMSEEIRPVKDQLENVGNQAGDLRQSLDKGLPKLSEPLEGLNDTLSPLAFGGEAMTTTTTP